MYNLYKQVLYDIIRFAKETLCMIRIACEYNIKEDIEFILDSERINYSALAEKNRDFQIYT